MLFRKDDKELSNLGMKSAAGLALYISLVGTFMTNANRIFGRIDDSFLGPVLFLTMFVMSALISSLIVFYKPYQLFVNNKGKDALQLVVYTTKWIAVFFFLCLAALLIIS